MNKATLRKIVEALLSNLRGDSFQDLCDRLCMELYSNDYTPVRAVGQKGTLKMMAIARRPRFILRLMRRGEKKPKPLRKKLRVIWKVA